MTLTYWSCFEVNLSMGVPGDESQMASFTMDFEYTVNINVPTSVHTCSRKIAEVRGSYSILS